VSIGTLRLDELLPTTGSAAHLPFAFTYAWMAIGAAMVMAASSADLLFLLAGWRQPGC
jgi:hypothetical protein